MILTVLRSIGHLYGRMFLCWNLYDVFLMSRPVYGLGEKDHTGKCHSITSFQGDSQDLFIGDDLGHLAEVMGVRFLLCELNSFFSISILTSLEGSHSHCPHLRSGKLGSLSLRVEYLRKLSGILFS